MKVQKRRGRGRVHWSASPATEKWTNVFPDRRLQSAQLSAYGVSVLVSVYLRGWHYKDTVNDIDNLVWAGSSEERYTHVGSWSDMQLRVFCSVVI